MFVVEITAALVTLIALANVTGLQPAAGASGAGFQVQIAIWLWFTVLFATYAEAVAEARGRAQAATLRKTRSETTAHRRRADGSLEAVGSSSSARATSSSSRRARRSPATATSSRASASSTRPRSPASRRRSSRSRARTSAARSPAARRSSATASSSASRPIPGETFLDRMIALVEGAKRQRTPNEIALAILLAGLTIVFLMATVTLRPFGELRGHDRRHGRARRAPRLPDPDDDRRPAVRDRHRRHGPRRPLQRARDERPRGRGVRRRRRDPARQDRHDHLRQPARRVDHGRRRASTRPTPCTAALVASIRDETPEGRSIVELARARLRELGAAGRHGRRGRLHAPRRPTIAEEIPFRAETRTSGVRTDRRRASILKGAVDAIERRPRRRRCRRRSSPRPTRSPTSARRRSRSAGTAASSA